MTYRISKRPKDLLYLVLILALVCALLPVMAQRAHAAGTEYPLWVGGRQVTSNNRNDVFNNGKVKFIPGFSYTLYAKRDGYFSIYREFNASDLMMRDTLMLSYMERTERGSTFPIKNIYFEDGDAALIPGTDTALMQYVACS